MGWTRALDLVERALRAGAARPSRFCTRHGTSEGSPQIDSIQSSGADHIAAAQLERIEPSFFPESSIAKVV
jgi:hypothetical protein